MPSLILELKRHVAHIKVKKNPYLLVYKYYKRGKWVRKNITYSYTYSSYLYSKIREGINRQYRNIVSSNHKLVCVPYGISLNLGEAYSIIGQVCL